MADGERPVCRDTERTIAIELQLILPGWSFRQFGDCQREHWLDESDRAQMGAVRLWLQRRFGSWSFRWAIASPLRRAAEGAPRLPPAQIDQ
jgi:hypothetical protein